MKNEEILKIFPEFFEISDLSLRTKALTAMGIAMKMGGWNQENIHICPVTLNWKNCKVSWVEHVTDVTHLCMLQYDSLVKYYNRNRKAFSRDTVICGALLHDIGKLTEFCPRDGKAVHSETADLLRHPLSGAIIAAQAELPAEIVHLIATHSFEGDRSYQTAESKFVRAIDIFVFNCSVEGLEKA